MRRLIAIIALLGLAIPAGAEEPLVVDLDYNWAGGRTHERVNPENPIYSSIEGYFLVLEWGEPGRTADSDSPNLVSFDVSDPTIVQVVAYPDGTVEFIREEPETKSTPKEDSVSAPEEFPQIDWSHLIPFGVYLK